MLPEKSYRDLEFLAHEQGKSKTEVLRDAVSLERWFQEARNEGGKILVERDGEIREIVLR